MIYLIVKSYFTILLSIGLVSICLLAIGLYFIFCLPKKSLNKIAQADASLPANKKMRVNMADVTAIAGDDPLLTQLDLARAYLETGNGELAKKMLNKVIKHGSLTQQHEAKLLLNKI